MNGWGTWGPTVTGLEMERRVRHVTRDDMREALDAFARGGVPSRIDAAMGWRDGTTRALVRAQWADRKLALHDEG